jgi:hypothetical protein
MSCALFTGPPGAPPERFTGGFIQYQSWMVKTGRDANRPYSLDAATWRKELEAMARAQMDTAIIQRLRAHDVSLRAPADAEGAVDPTEEVLKFADARGMAVFVGLWSGSIWNDEKRVVAADPTLLATTQEEDVRVAAEEGRWHPHGNTAIVGRCPAGRGPVRGALQHGASAQRHRPGHPPGQAGGPGPGHLAERDRKLEAARERRKQQRQAARQAALDGQPAVATT